MLRDFAKRRKGDQTIEEQDLVVAQDPKPGKQKRCARR
jgi:hypothetical protein